MKIFLMAYARKNLGDDIFIKMLLERYPMHDFYMKIENYEYLRELDNFPNLHVTIGEDTDEEIFKTDVTEYDAYIYIGGSIFMEGGKVYNLSEKFYDFIKRCKDKEIPFSYISCNYGPYQTQEYLDLSKQTFTDCHGICFRDKYSYNMFKDIEKVRYAPDYIFTYQMDKETKIPDSVGISVIDLNIREDLKNKHDDYIAFLTANIENYLKQNKKIYLFSFCNAEGDENVIDTILEKFEENPNIKGIRYDGKIEEFLDIYGKMEYMICARFHSLILSCVSNQKVYVMSYSKKIDNVIEDLDLDVPIIHFNELDRNHIIDLEKFKVLEDEKILEISMHAENQDLVLKNL